MFNQGGYHPSPITAAAGTLVITSARNLADPVFLNAALIAVFFAISIQHIARSKHHQDTAAVDFAIDLSVLAFISFPGSFLVDIRNLPDGLYWTLVCFFSTALGDIGAFAIGSLIGKHKLAPLISPNKSVEGYLGGIVGRLSGRIGCRFDCARAAGRYVSLLGNRYWFCYWRYFPAWRSLEKYF